MLCEIIYELFGKYQYKVICKYPEDYYKINIFFCEIYKK